MLEESIYQGPTIEAEEYPNEDKGTSIQSRFCAESSPTQSKTQKTIKNSRIFIIFS
jgi:hypothetical protein